MAKRRQIRAWIRVNDNNTNEIYRIEVDAWCVKINGVDLIVHESPGFHNGLKLWNLSDPICGAKLGSKRSSMDSAIRLGRDYIRNLEKEFGQPFTELIKAKQEFFGNTMTLSEKKGEV